MTRRAPAKPDPFEAIAASLPDFGDDATLSLREASKLDPPVGCPMNLAKRGEPEEPVEPGEWRIKGFVDHRTGLPVNCPVIPLGTSGEVYFFLNPLGEVHTIKDTSAGKGPIDGLFKGRPYYLEWAWPRFGKPKADGSPSISGYHADEARRLLFAACAYKGVFELEDRVRGRGAWRDDDGALIYHAGDAIWIGGQWRAPGEHGRFIYPGRPPIGRPALRHEDAGEGSPGDVLFKGLQSWNWTRGELDAKLALGWLMCALVGGALEQRPSIYVAGGEGSGKSTLQKLFRALMQGALVASANTTQAGIYQKVQQDSIAVLVDELEAKEDTRTTDKILELARVAYSGDKMQRGGKEGAAKEFSVFSAFMFSSIARPPIDAQDASRMGVLDLRPRDPNAPGADALVALGLTEDKAVRRVGAALLRRMFAWFELDAGVSRWDRLRGAFKQALLGCGHDDRSADTFGALAAGAHCALRDGYPDAGELEAWSDLLRADSLIETTERDKTWERCWSVMLNRAPEVLKQRGNKTLAAILRDYRKDCEAGAIDLKTRSEKAQDELELLGVSLTFPPGCEHSFKFARLFVPIANPNTRELFRGTAWEGREGAPGPWAGVLRQMPERYWITTTCRRGFEKPARGIAIDLALISGETNDQQDE